VLFYSNLFDPAPSGKVYLSVIDEMAEIVLTKTLLNLIGVIKGIRSNRKEVRQQVESIFKELLLGKSIFGQMTLEM